MGLGRDGERAFANLAKSITLAEIPLRRNGEFLNDLWTTLKKTAKWQFSNSAVNNLVGAIQSAYGYAKDLNRSLNDIRIVTGASTERMAEFAREANNAARALSTTTTDYTKASLIFYQQGLSDSQVKERTDITIKMANAARTSAEEVSDQLTAVWNNFYDGSKSLEYYADIMTALGAATATSTEEISAGLSKFAAVAGTVGLSYEYATAALATITSNTRESADIVGNSLKTLFARIQGLKLGETLEDGTTLNKYSEALLSVGISIYDTNGELKKMDSILDEMAAKWQDLNKAQQVALANTVAGVRQYNQLIALMENWDVGDADSMMANLETAKSSTGALQEQADIYAESWEAARDRVKASAEAVYSAILNDEFFISLSNGFAVVLDGIEAFIDGLGGVKSILLSLGAIVTNVFSHQIGEGLSRLTYNIAGWINPNALAERERNTQREINDLLASGFRDIDSFEGRQKLTVYEQLAQEQETYANNVQRMSEREQRINQILLDRNRILANLANDAGERAGSIDQAITVAQNNLYRNAQRLGRGRGTRRQIDTYGRDLRSQSVATALQGKVADSVIPDDEALENLRSTLKNVFETYANMSFDDMADGVNRLATSFRTLTHSGATDLFNAINTGDLSQITTQINNLSAAANDASTRSLAALNHNLSGISDTDLANAMTTLTNSVSGFGAQVLSSGERLTQFNNQSEELIERMRQQTPRVIEFGEGFSEAASSVMAAAQGIIVFKSLIENIDSGTVGIADVVAGFTALIPVLMSVVSLIRNFNVQVTILNHTMRQGWLTLAVMGVAALATALVYLATRETEAEKKARKAAEAAESMKAAAEETKQAFEDLKNAFNNYDTAVEKLNDCRKGTEEWNQALKEVNNTVLDILKNNPELAKSADLFSRDKYGALIVNEEERDRILEQAERRAYVIDAGAAAATARVAQVNAENEYNRIINSNEGILFDQGRGGLNVGTFLEENMSDLIGLDETEYREIVRERALKEVEQYNVGMTAADFDDKVEYFIDTCVKYQDQIDNLTKETEEAAIQMRNTALVLAEQELGNEYGEAEKAMSANAYGQAYQDAYDRIIETDAEKNSKDQHSTTTSEEIWKKYNEVQGTNYLAVKNQIRGNDNNRKYAYVDEFGEEQEVTIEHIAATIAAAEALEEMGNTAREAATKLQEIEDTIGSENADVLKGFIAGNGFIESNYTDFDQFYKMVAQSDIKDNSGNTVSKSDVSSFVGKTFGDENGVITDEIAIKYNYKSAQEMIDDFYKQIDAAQSNWSSLTIREADLFGLEELSNKQATELDKAFKKVSLGATGEYAGQQFIDGLNSMIEGLDEEDAHKALAQLADVDWSSWDAMEQAKVVLEGFNKDLDLSSDEWLEFAENMRKATNAIPDLSSVRQDLTTISAGLEDIEFGDVISKEDDYEELIAANKELEQFFMTQADGTHKFIGDVEKVKKAIRDESVLAKQELTQRKELIDAVTENGSDWKISSESIKEKHGSDGELTEAEINDSMADEAYNLINNDVAIQEILSKNGYSMESIGTIITEARNGNRERLEVMLQYLDNYMSQDLALEEAILNEQLASTASSIGELDKLYNQKAISAEAYEKQVKYLSQVSMEEVENLNDLKAAWNEALSTGVELDYNIYADNLKKLGEEYSICKDEIKAFENALLSGDGEVVKNAEANLEASIMLGEAAETYDLNLEELNVHSKQLAKEHELNAKAAAQLAIQNQRMNKGVSDLVDNWEDWQKELKKTDKTSQDWVKAAQKCTKTIADLVGASADLELPEDFFESEDNLKLLEEAAKGSEKAINKLGVVVAKAQVQMMQFQDGMTSADGKTPIKQDEFDTWKNTILTGIDELQNSLSDLTIGDNVYEQLGGDKWIAALNEMAIATKMSVDDMNALLNSMGVQAEVEVKSVKQKMMVPTYTDYVERDEQGIDVDGDGSPDAFGYRRFTVPGDPVEVEGTVQVAQVKAANSDIGSPKVTYTGNGNVSSSAAKGSNKNKKGGGSKQKKADKVKKSDIVERYKEVNDLLDDVTDAMEDASKAADRLYGKGRLDAMKRNNDLLKKEIELTKQKRQEAEKYLKEDLNAMFKAASDAGVILTTDGNGLITNYTEAMTKLYNELDAEITKANKDGNADENEQARIDKIKERIEALKDAISQYDETRELIEDLDDELEEQFYQWQDNNYEMLTYELEIKLELNEDELKLIDYYLNKISDDFYQMAEAAALMVGQDGNDQLSIYSKNLSDYGDQVKYLEDAYAEGEISQSAFVEGMREARGGILSNLESLNDLDSSMMHYYGETLAAAGEEIAKYVDQMSHLTTVLDHYQSLMGIMGKSTDYESIGVILEGKVQVLSDQAAVAKETMEMYKDQAEQRYADYEKALLDGDEAAAELYLQQYQDALAAANEAEQEYLSKAEEWAEALTEVLKNKLNSLGRDLEKALTGGMSFDRLNTGMERAKAIQEEYLTTTNKIYETNKLMRKAQQEIDKTSNSIAKKRLQEFITETDQLQDKAKLSNFELEIQQAKYDLLLAEIALQEAQNAKSTVRLQRDSEGNFGYVYTADEAIIADAEQTLLDKQNALYNISLEGANNYKEKYLQTLNEMYDTLADLQQQKLEGAFASEEEYQQAVQEATLYYYGMLEQYSYLHGVAIATDGRVLNEAWGQEFNDMVQDTASWKDDVDLYLSQAADAFIQWQDGINTIAEEVGIPLTTIGSSVGDVVNQFNALKDRVKDVTDESKLLREQIIGEDGIIVAVKDEMKAVVDVTKKYADLRGELNKVKSAYEDIIVAINKTIETQSQLANTPAPNVPSNGTSSTGGSSNANVSGGNTSSGGSSNGTSQSGTSNGSVGYKNEGKSKEEVKRAQGWVGVAQDGKWGPKSQRAGKNSPAKSSSVTKVLEYMDSHSGGGGGRGGSVSAGWLPRQEYMLFDTGGYTGKWGSYGKWAMLHEKELVLNAKDTENFLAGMGILDKIISIIDLHSANSQLGGLLSAPSYGEFRDNQILEQSVHIEASFPNATNHSEIEEAFNNLINTASQYANRK